MQYIEKKQEEIKSYPNKAVSKLKFHRLTHQVVLSPQLKSIISYKELANRDI